MDAKSLRFSLIGHPVSHSVSPAIHSAAFSALGLPYEYTAVDLKHEGHLNQVLAQLRSGALAGVNITIPYKRAVMERADEIAPSAAEVGAANVLCRDPRGRITAHNTDAQALADELTALTAGRKVLRAVVIGAGGAGLAALSAGKRSGFKVIGITSRSWVTSEGMFDAPASERARTLGALTTLWPKTDPGMAGGKSSQMLRLQWRELATGADCVIQATSAGMLGADPGEEVASIVPWKSLPAHALAYDLVYNPRVTPFLKQARAHGLRAVDGLGMLVRQAALSFSLWTGLAPPLEAMRFAAENAMERTGATG
jgi:shikimate dehydrogenase